MTRMRCIRGDATFAMKNAIGSARATSIRVTSERHAERAQGHRLIQRAGDHRHDVVERPGRSDLPGEAVDRPERRHEQQHERHDVDDPEPEQRRAEQQGQPRARMGAEEHGCRARRRAAGLRHRVARLAGAFAGAGRSGSVRRHASSSHLERELLRVEAPEGVAASNGGGAARRAERSVVRAGSALDLLPRLGPRGVVGALHVGASVEALLDRGRPVPDLRRVVRVTRVVRLAVLAVLAGLVARGRLAEVRRWPPRSPRGSRCSRATRTRSSGSSTWTRSSTCPTSPWCPLRGARPRSAHPRPQPVLRDLPASCRRPSRRSRRPGSA